jgi:hypothetical protein
MSEYINVVDKETLMLAWACGQGPNKVKAIIPNVVIEYEQGEWAERDIVGYLQSIAYEDGSGQSFNIGVYVNRSGEDGPGLEFVKGYLDLRKKNQQDKTNVILGDNNIVSGGNITVNDSVVVH